MSVQILHFRHGRRLPALRISAAVHVSVTSCTCGGSACLSFPEEPCQEGSMCWSHSRECVSVRRVDLMTWGHSYVQSCYLRRLLGAWCRVGGGSSAGKLGWKKGYCVLIGQPGFPAVSGFRWIWGLCTHSWLSVLGKGCRLHYIHCLWKLGPMMQHKGKWFKYNCAPFQRHQLSKSPWTAFVFVYFGERGSTRVVFYFWVTGSFPCPGGRLRSVFVIRFSFA
jgi:hypothetical protein